MGKGIRWEIFNSLSILEIDHSVSIAFNEKRTTMEPKARPLVRAALHLKGHRQTVYAYNSRECYYFHYYYYFNGIILLIIKCVRTIDIECTL